MTKLVAGKMPLRKFNLWGIAFPRGTGHSPFPVCPLDQSGAHPSLAPTNLSVHLPFHLFLTGFSASSFLQTSFTQVSWDFRASFTAAGTEGNWEIWSLMIFLLINLIHLKVSSFIQGVGMPDCWRWLNSGKILRACILEVLSTTAWSQGEVPQGRLTWTRPMKIGFNCPTTNWKYRNTRLKKESMFGFEFNSSRDSILWEINSLGLLCKKSF